MPTLINAMARNAVGLGIFAMVTAGLIALTQHFTADEIQAQHRRAQAGALLEIVPRSYHDNMLLDTAFTIRSSELLGLKTTATGYRARLNGEVSGVILPVTAPDGYSGPIRLVMGIARNGTVLGVRVVEHHETPGLGDKIEVRKSDWTLGFNGRSLGAPPADQWQVKKRGGDFDQFVGATITPNAVVTAVKAGLTYFRTHREALLGDAGIVPESPRAAQEITYRGN